MKRLVPYQGLGTLLIILSLTLPSLAYLALGPPIARAQKPTVLASMFAPVLHFTSAEKFYPTSVDYLIQSSALKERLANGSSVVITPSPSNSTLGSYNSTTYLENKLGTLDAIAADYSSKASSIGYFAYVHVVNGTSSTVIQYWLFYAYNNGPLNDHQGDLEVVQVFLDSSGNPQRAVYSQHGAGENAAWSDVEKVGTHPVVYVAQGSHANYFRPYQGKIGIENDVVGSNGRTLPTDLTTVPTDLTLVALGEQGNHSLDQSWLDYPGRWGYVGTPEQVSLGEAGPPGPVFNQNGVRWSQPQSYLNSTLGVNGNYFILAFLAAYFLIIFATYFAIRGAWKIVAILRLHRKEGLRVKNFLKSRGLLGLIIGTGAILITVAALFLPWYSISASSQAGPLAGQGDVTLLNIDGIHGMQVNLFLGTGSDSTSGFTSLFFLQIPFGILIAVGAVLLALDVIGVKSGKSLGRKFMLGAISSLTPFILILVFIIELPTFIPFASSLTPGQALPSQFTSMLNSMASSPVSGTSTQQFPVVGSTTVNWGFGLGAYLFLVAATVRIVGGFIIRTTPELGKTPGPAGPAVATAPPPSP